MFICRLTWAPNIIGGNFSSRVVSEATSTFLNLIPATFYVFNVAAQNAVGVGPSTTLMVATQRTGRFCFRI